ncbi:hypothetical protein NHQ30_009174 [Ciborinia camelliae]|nr:hypothetical protein NHQ30_009174 [Ciborinia camelliae]
MENILGLPTTAPIELTFGFELEFAIASVPDQFLDPDPDDPRAVHGITRPEYWNKNEFLPYILPKKRIDGEEDEEESWPPVWQEQIDALKTNIAELLNQNGFPAVPDIEYDATVDDNTKISDLKYWVISMDHTIAHGPDDRSNYYWWPIEIQSPAYIYNEENKQKVRKVLQLIDKTYRTKCDLSADTHIHIGNGLNGFDVSTIRKLMAFVWTFERQLATIHPPHYMTEKAFSQPLTTHSMLATMGKRYRDRIVLEGTEEELKDHDTNFVIDRIMEIDTIDEIVTMLSSPLLNQNRLTKRLIYSICNLETGREKVKKTIEFRQHKSTLDDEEVYHWITVCRFIVNLAIVADEEILSEFCKEHLHKTVDEFTIVEVLMTLLLPEQAYYYGVRVFAERK